MTIVNILDMAGALSLASADALDLLVAGGRRVIVTEQVSPVIFADIRVDGAAIGQQPRISNQGAGRA